MSAYKLIVKNATVILKTVTNAVLNITGIKDLLTGTGSVDSNNKINWTLQEYTNTAANFTSDNPILLLGQKGIETDDLLTAPKFKIGDGVTAWNDLPYFSSGGGGSQSLQDVVAISPTVEGVLAESLDTTQKYEITDSGLKLNGNTSTTAKLITLNKDGVANSSTGSGIEIEEDGNIVGYIKTSIGTAFQFLHPLKEFYLRISLSGLTASRVLSAPDANGTIAITSDLDTKLNIAATQTTGVALTFVTDSVYGSIATPETGNITYSSTNAVLGCTNIIIHNSGTAPTFGTNMKKLSGSGDYVVSVVNYIYVTYINSTEVIYSINQRT